MDSVVRNPFRMLLTGIVVSLALMLASADVGGADSPAAALHSAPGQSATLLPSGDWLLLGGRTDEGRITGTAILMDAQSQQRQVLPRGLNVPRAGQTASVLPDGTVLVIGGTDPAGQPVAAVERYHPDTREFESLGDIGLEARSGHTATLLGDGRLLIVGGTDVTSLVHGDAELLDTTSLHVVDTSGSLAVPRIGQQARLLGTGDVLIWGGRGPGGQVLQSAELFQVGSGHFVPLSTEAAAAILDADNATSAPAVKATYPEAESTGVPVGARLSVLFSKPLQPGSLTDQSVTLIGPAGPVEARVVAAEGGMVAFITPNEPLLPATRYTLFVQGAKDGASQSVPFTAAAFQTASLPPSPAKRAAATANTRQAEAPADDSDGELWTPARRNLSGVWRSGQAHIARHHHPARSTLSRALYGEAVKNGLPEAPAGVTAVAGQVLRLNGAPLAKVTLSIGSRRVVTDRNGEFLLADVPGGTQALVIDGTTADHENRHYGRYEYRAVLEAGKTNALPFVIWMTRLDTRNAASIPSPTTSEAVVTNPHIPGLELHIPAGTVVRDSQGNNVTQVTITAIPVDQPPFPLPNHQVPVYFTIQPGGAHLQGLTVDAAKGARLIYPNFGNSPAGARIDFWNYDPRVKGWYVYGQGTVTADGKQITPDPGVAIYEFTGAMVALPSTAPAKGPAQGGCESGSANASVHAGDPVDCYTGLFVHSRTDLSIADVLPLQVSRSYRQNDSASRAFGIGTNLSYDIFLIGDTNPWTYQDLILPDGGRVHYTRTSSGTSYADAVYTTTTPGRFYGSAIRYNTAINSGWLLTFPDGTVYTFPDSYQSASARCAALTAIKDRYGNALAFARDSNCNLTSITSPNGRRLTFTYDTANRITRAADDIGRTVTYQYDSGGRLITATDPANQSETYTYDSSNRMLTVTDKRGHVMVTNTYDSNGRVSQQTYADGTNTSFSYTLDANGNATQMDFTNERGVVKRVQFNAAGLPTSIVHALGKPEQQTITIARDPTTNLAQSVTDALGRVTAFQYDGKGNVTQVTQLYGTANASTWKYSYEPTFNQLASVTDPANHTTTYTYDSAGNLTTVTDALGNATSFSHNAAGQVTSSTRTAGGSALTMTATYSGGDLASLTDPLNRTTQVFTDGVGRVVTMKDPLGNLSRVTYDALNRVTQTTGPLGNTLQYTYDPNGNLLTFQDPRGSVTTYTYDSRDRVSSMTDPLNHVETYVYDAAGNRTRSTDRNGQVTGISYDSLNRATSVGFGASASSPTAYTSTIGYTWDAGNRLKQLVDSVSGTINLGFDDLDRLVTETSPQGQVAYTYYTNGLRQTMTVQGYNPVTYTYDDDGRLTQLVQGRATVGFTYDTADRRTSLTLPNGVQVGYTYDNAGQLTALTYQNGSTSIGNLTYGYDAAGRRTSVGGTLAQVTLPTAVSTASYDAANRLTSWGGSPLSYDNNGNLTAFGSSTYSWDARNQLVATSDGTGSFAYDAFGRRTTRTVAGATATYLHDGINPAVANGDFLLQSLGLDEIYARINAAGATSYLHDGLGSTSALTDGSGAVTASFAYEPYGATKRTGTDDTSFRFTGREDDGATKLYYYRARYYSPQLGRFISQDPIGLAGGANGYEYAGGNPVSFSDPLGLFITSVDAACAQNPDFCLEIMGQMVKNAAAASGNPCLEEQADQTADALNTVGNVLAVASVLHGAIPEGAAGKKLGYVRDFPTKETKNWSAMMNSEGEARALAREKLGTDPVEVEPGKWRSKDGKWQYRAKPGDVSDNHIHLEELDPETGEVLQNVHLRWPAGTGR